MNDYNLVMMNKTKILREGLDRLENVLSEYYEEMNLPELEVLCESIGVLTRMIYAPKRRRKYHEHFGRSKD